MMYLKFLLHKVVQENNQGMKKILKLLSDNHIQKTFTINITLLRYSLYNTRACHAPVWHTHS